MPMPSNMEHQFSRVPAVNIQRSSFDRSHGYKTTFDAGRLIPFFVDEALPGDTFNLKTTAFARLATPLHPVMDNMFMDTHYFAVPYRLVWDNWEKFNGAQENPGDSISFLIPQQAAADDYATNSIGDYFGIPTGIAGLTPNSLAFRAYNLIYNEWFRDQNLTGSTPVPKDDGPDAKSDFVIRRRSKRHDYFTSCLPWPQKGDPVSLPLGTTAPIQAVGAQGLQTITQSTGGVQTFVASSTGSSVFLSPASPPGGVVDYHAGLEADLSTATAATINDIREAFQIQKLLERDARGGTRYTEIIRSHFGVVSPDARLQRPEYLGGGSSPVNITPIPQTSETGTSPQGNLAAFGTVALNNHGFTKSFTEHCIIIGIVSVRADLTYQQGLDRMWSRQTRYDFYWPALAQIGEQAVLSKEIYVDGTANDEDVFGYQERYAEYRYKPSKVTGVFRSNAPATLDSWHLSQEFSPRPLLNQSFIQETPPIDRIVAVPSEPDFIFDSYINLRCARPMPLYGVPGFIDHF